VTGATSGIGLGIATALAQAGVHVTFDYLIRMLSPYQTNPSRKAGLND
jgi:NAD(P)-dependent dehydrogenase (short-subunit alcohol dehydrogenase family)